MGSRASKIPGSTTGLACTVLKEKIRIAARRSPARSSQWSLRSIREATEQREEAEDGDVGAVHVREVEVRTAVLTEDRGRRSVSTALTTKLEAARRWARRLTGKGRAPCDGAAATLPWLGPLGVRSSRSPLEASKSPRSHLEARSPLEVPAGSPRSPPEVHSKSPQSPREVPSLHLKF